MEGAVGAPWRGGREGGRGGEAVDGGPWRGGRGGGLWGGRGGGPWMGVLWRPRWG